FYNGGTIDSNNLGGKQHEGKTYIFEDVDLTAGAGSKKVRSGRYVKAMIVRNVAAAALLPKRLVTFQLSGSDPIAFVGRVDGYATTTAQEAFPLDEFLPSTGLPINDLGYIVIEG